MFQCGPSLAVSDPALNQHWVFDMNSSCWVSVTDSDTTFSSLKLENLAVYEALSGQTKVARFWLIMLDISMSASSADTRTYNSN